MGIKDRTLLPDDREAQLRRDLVTRIILDRLFSSASEVRESLRQQDLVDDTLSASYMSEHSFGVTVVSCETDDPEQSIQTLRELLFADLDLDEEYLERVRRKFLGQYVRSFANPRSMAFSHAKEALDDQAPFQSMQRMMSLTLDEVRTRKDELFREDAFAAAIVECEPMVGDPS